MYVNPVSAPCRAVQMTAKAANIQLETKIIYLHLGQNKTEEFRKINPEEKVPALDDNGFKLWESRAIMAYLVDTYAPGNAVYPRDVKKRAVIDRILFTDIDVISKSVHAFLMPQLREGKPADREKSAEVEKALDYLENVLQTDKFLTGTEVTIADISIMASLSMLELKDWEFQRWPKVDSWRGKMKALKYYDEVNKQPFEEFREMMKETLKEAVQERLDE